MWGHRDAGSRQNGWELLRERLKNAMKPEGPRLFVFNHCRQFIRTVPVLPRDEIDRDDVDNAVEDHVATRHGTGRRPARIPAAGGTAGSYSASGSRT